MSQLQLRHGIFLPPFHPMEENPTQPASSATWS